MTPSQEIRRRGIPINSGPFRLRLSHRALIYAALLLFALPALLPFASMVATSLKSEAQIATEGDALTIRTFLPENPRWSNYAEAMRSVPFALYLRNTLALCATIVFGTLLSSSIVAYGFARIPFKGSKAIFAVMLATMAIPGQTTMIPSFALWRAFGVYVTYIPLALPAFFGSAFSIFLLYQFFRTIPTETIESARLDGASEWRILRQIVVPLSRSALATCALFAFLGTWNDFFGPLLYINDPNRYTMAYGLQQFLGAYGSKWGQLMAASTLFTLPIILLFFFAQRTFVQGIKTSGGK